MIEKSKKMEDVYHTALYGLLRATDYFPKKNRFLDNLLVGSF